MKIIDYIRKYFTTKDKSKNMIEIGIDGVVETPLSRDEFYNKFIDFLEENGSYFGGGINRVEYNEGE